MRWDQIEHRKPEDFQRLTGVKPQVFAQMLEAVRADSRVWAPVQVGLERPTAFDFDVLAGVSEHGIDCSGV